MFRIVAIGSLSLLMVGPASAGCVGAVVNGECRGGYVDNPYVGSNSSRDSGYQYDLNDPSDRNRYSLDLDAQRRDSMSLDMDRSLERGLGQYGGGQY